MIRFAQFYRTINDELLGSDGIILIDGRLSVMNAIKCVLNDVHTKYLKRNHLAIGFEIRKGTILDNKVESEFIMFVEDKTK